MKKIHSMLANVTETFQGSIDSIANAMTACAVASRNSGSLANLKPETLAQYV